MSLPKRNLKFTKEHLKPGIDWARIQDEVDQIDIPGGYLHRDLIWILEELAALQMGYEDEAPETNEETLWDAAHSAYREAYGNRITKGADQRKLLNAYNALRAQAKHFEGANSMIYREGKRIFTSTTKLRQIVRKTLVKESRQGPTNEIELEKFADRLAHIADRLGHDEVYETLEHSAGSYNLIVFKLNGEKWYIFDEEGAIGLEDQSMGYIQMQSQKQRINRGQYIPTSKEASHKGLFFKPNYFGREFGDVRTRPDMRQEAYAAIEAAFTELLQNTEQGIHESRRVSGKGIMGIVKQHGGKRIPKEGPWAPSQYEFPDEQIAAKVVWLIHDATGREAVNDGKIVSVYR